MSHSYIITSHPYQKSVKQLVKIRMLNLGGNSSLQEISIIGELGELEILILNDTNIHEIPQEIGKLDNLRRLEVKRCTSLSHIAPGVISNLRWLEELCIGYYQVQKENYNSLSELRNLSKLRHLNLFVTDYDLIPQGVQFGKLEEFVIKIGNNDENIVFPWELKSKHLLILAKISLNITFLPHIEELIKVSDCILMHSVSNLNDILPSVYYEASHELKTIALLECCSDSYLVDTKYWDELFGPGKIQERIFSRLEHLKLSSLKLMSALWKCPDAYISLSKLVTLDIGDSPKLVRLFSVSVAQGLVNLKNLSISKCHCLAEVIWTRDADTGSGEIDMAIPDADIVFPRLTHITFSDLSKLKRFYSGYSSIKYPSLVEVSIVHCPIMEIWGYGVHDTPKLKFLGNVPLDGTLAINDAVIALSKVETL
ncbi:NB-ARC domains-containing protein [Artemisia annua]|uniref:NB-ARC domains-containing protein n=1 Tax=Artemisia annua TaxID=35608 RepID=A0A2U1QAW2_ARTAN|nr:NB-ARC domains-containing protein [Artemisia annua]